MTTYADAKIILSGTGCGSMGALNCMAGMLLAAELNLAQGGSTCIQSVVNDANALLVKYWPRGQAPANLSSMRSGSGRHSDSTQAKSLRDGRVDSGGCRIFSDSTHGYVPSNLSNH